MNTMKNLYNSTNKDIVICEKTDKTRRPAPCYTFTTFRYG